MSGNRTLYAAAGRSYPGRIRTGSGWGRFGGAARCLWLVAAVVLTVAVTGAAATRTAAAAMGDLDVVASIRPSGTDNWELVGRVIFEGGPAVDAAVWAIAADGRGNRHSPPPVRTDSLGGFILGPIPNVVGPDSSHTITRIFVQSQIEWRLGADTVSVTGHQDLRIICMAWYQKSLYWLVASFIIFLVSIAVAVLYWNIRLLYWKYYISVFLAVTFTVTTIAYISFAMREVNAIGPDGEAPQLGFVNLFKGTYVKDVEPEWLVSLTAQQTQLVKTGDGAVVLEKGMGAPLWVLLLAVIGAALFTVILLIEAITDRPKKSALDDWLLMDEVGASVDQWRQSISKKIKRLVKHQFFILFAPIGAIFIYQMLVISDTAKNQLTVAVASLAAGLSLYWLLGRALVLVESLFKPGSKNPKQGSKAGAQGGEPEAGATEEPPAEPSDEPGGGDEPFDSESDTRGG